ARKIKDGATSGLADVKKRMPHLKVNATPAGALVTVDDQATAGSDIEVDRGGGLRGRDPAGRVEGGRARGDRGHPDEGRRRREGAGEGRGGELERAVA